jgi:hypothetical protein
MKYLFLLVFIISCGKRSALIFEVPQENSFKSLTTNVLQTKCVTCHKNFAIEDNLLAYINENDPDTSKLFEVVKNGSMPKKAPPLTTLELEMVRNYIQKVEVVKAVTFDQLKKEIIEPKCIGCHKKSGDEAFIVEKWVNKKSLFESKLFTATKSGAMPKKSSPLSKQEMLLIKGYLKSK